MKEGQTKIVITGGGTGGHIFPALAIADDLTNRGFCVLYVGSPDGMEAKLVPKRGYQYFGVRSIQVKNKNPIILLLGVFTLLGSVLWSIRFLKKEKPGAVLGVGGYVSVPVAVASFFVRIPLYLQEQNASVGIANRFLGKFSKQIFIGFERAQSSFPKNRSIITGNPIRKEFTETKFGSSTLSPPCVFIFGGSQGAKAVNSVILDLLPLISSQIPDLSIIHQTGQFDYDRVREKYGTRPNTQIMAFIEDMVACYKQASLVICRSGALSISELLAVKRPAVLVPYPRKGQNDQTSNAYMLQELGVARVVEEGERFQERFWTTFSEVLQPEVFEKMVESFSRLQVPDALATIGDHLARDLSGKVRGNC